MKNPLRRLINIKEGEGALLSLNFVFFFFMSVTYVIGYCLSDSLFLKVIGKEHLPTMLVFNSVVVVLATFVYFFFADLINNYKLFVYVIILLAILITISRFLIEMDSLTIGAFNLGIVSVYIMFLIFKTIVPAHFGVYLQDIYDPMTAKRLFPIIYTGSGLGFFLGGVMLNQLVEYISPENLLLLSVAIMMIGLLFLTIIQRKILSDNPNEQSRISENKRRKKLLKSSLNNIKTGYHFIKSSQFLMVLAIFVFIFNLIEMIQYFHSMNIFQAEYETKEELTAFLGIFMSVASILMLIIQLFITPGLIKHMGVGYINIIIPTASLIGFILLSISYNLYSGIYTRFINITLTPALFFPVLTTLFFAVPQKVRTRARTFITGIVAPIAIGFAGLALILFRLGSIEYQYTTVFFAIVCIFFIYWVFILKKKYTTSLIKTLSSDDIDLIDNELLLKDKNTIKYFTEKLDKSAEEFDIIVFTELISQISLNQESQQKLIEILVKKYSEGTTDVKKTILKVFKKLGLNNKKIINICIENIVEKLNDEIVLLSLDIMMYTGGKTDINALLSLIEDENPHIFATSSMLLFYYYPDRKKFVNEAIVKKLCSNNVHDMYWAIWIARKIGNYLFMVDVLERLDYDDVELTRISLEYLLSYIKSTVYGVTRFYPYGLLIRLNKLQYHGDDEVRLIVLQLYEQSRNINLREKYFEYLSDPHEKTRDYVLSKIETDNMQLLEDVFNYYSNFGNRENRVYLGITLCKLMNRYRSLEKDVKTYYYGLITFLQVQLSLMEDIYSSEEYFKRIDIEEKSVIHVSEILRERQEVIIKEILKLFAFLTNEQNAVEMVDTVINSLFTKDKGSRALALEALLNIGLKEISSFVVETIEMMYTTDRSTFESDIEEKIFFDRVFTMLGQTDSYIRLAGIIAISKAIRNKKLATSSLIKRKDIVSVIKSLSNNEQIFIRHAVLHLIKQIILNDEQQTSLEGIIDNRIYLQFDNHNGRKDIENIESLKHYIMGDFVNVSLIERVSNLKNTNLFKSMSIELLLSLSKICRMIDKSKDEVVFYEGEIGDSLYIIVDGEVDIFRDYETDNEQYLTTLTKSQSFGEMSVLTLEKRSATIVCKTECKFLQINHSQLLKLGKSNPDILIGIINTLSEIIRDKNK